MKGKIQCFGLCAVILFIARMTTAQDTRHVVEPVVPASCTILDAGLHAGPDGIAAADERKLDTDRIQKAIDRCTPGQGVELRPRGKNNAFLSGPIQLRQGITLIIDGGVTLFASRDAALYAITPGSCGVINQSGEGCKPLIGINHAANAGVMGEGAIDGRGGAKILGKDFSWWELGLRAKKGDRNAKMQQVCFRIIGAEYADNFTIYHVTLRNAPKFNISYRHGNGFTVWGMKIDTPMYLNKRRVALNTDGIDPGDGSKNITITPSFIRDGDDNVAITGGATNVTVSHNHFYWGHGMSIGSITLGGVSKVRVTDLSLDGSQNGIRIKSNSMRGGLVDDVVYDDVCVRNSPNPINFITSYEKGRYDRGESFPVYRNITLHNVRISGGGDITFNGYSHEDRIGVTLDGVLQTDQNAKYTYSIEHTDFHLGPGPVNLQLSGMDSTISGKAGTGTLAACSSKFVPFPG